MRCRVSSGLRTVMHCGLLACILGASSYARADGSLELRSVAAATASDEGPQDGVFDAFVPFNFGSVANNGWTSYRTAFEFSVADVPSGSTLSGATLTISIGAWEGPRSLAVHGYAADGGVIELADFSLDGLAGTATFDPGTYTLSFDVTPLVRTVLSNGGIFIGFNVREDPANTPNYVVMQMTMSGEAAPLLRIDYASLGVPGAQARLEPLPGSPFIFPVGSGSSQVPLLSPDGRHLFISSIGAQDIVVLDVAAASMPTPPDGALSMVGRFPSPGSSLGGMALSRDGQLLYAIANDALDVHAVDTAGRLTLLSTIRSGPVPRQPLNGIAYVQLGGGDFLYVNDNTAPNAVSAWRIEPGTATFVDSYATGAASGFIPGAGLVAAPTLATHGQRLFALNPSARTSPSAATVAVFDVQPDGSLVPVPGSPFDVGISASIALDPTGTVLYAGGASGDVTKLAVAPDGSLAPIAHAQVTGVVGKPNGLAVDPSGRWVAFTTPGTGHVVVLDAATLAPIENGVVPDAVLIPPNTTPWNAAGLVFDGAGRLFVGHTGGNPVVSVYQVVTGDTTPPVVQILTPAPSVVSGDLLLTVSAADEHLASIECTVGGASFGASTQPSFSTTVSTLAFLDGPLAIVCRALDAAGNVGSASASVTVRNWTETLAPETLEIGSSGQFVTMEVEGPNVALLLPVVPDLALAPPCGGFALAAPFAGSSVLQDADVDGVPELVVKFDRGALAALLAAQVGSGGVDPAEPVNIDVVNVIDGRVFGGATLRILP